MKYFFIVTVLLVTTFSSFSPAPFVSAQNCNPGSTDPNCLNPGGGGSGGGQYGGGSGGGQYGGTQLQNPISADSIQELIAQILSILVAIGTPIVIFFLIYTGFLFVTARGNEHTLETAKRSLVWTLIGGFILLGAQVLATLIQGTVNQIVG